MKRLFVAAVFAFAALILVAPHAHAFGIMGSWWNLKDSGHDGWGGGIRQEIPLLPWHHTGSGDSNANNSLLRLSLDTRASYLHFKDASLNMFPLEVGGLIGLGVLYAEGGGGYYIMDTTGSAPNLDNNWGWYVLGGFMLGKGARGLFGEVKYTKLTADIKNVDPDLGDVPHTLNADGVGVNVGISFGI